MAQTNRFRSVCATREGLVVLHPHRALPLHFTALVLHFVETAAPCLQGFRCHSSIVGYNTIPSVASGKFVALAVQFEATDGNAIAVKDLVSMTAPAGTGAISDGADQIWRWNSANANWDKYFYRSGRGVTNPGWTKSGETAPTTDTVGAGETVFFCRNGSAAAALTLAGGVKPFTATPSYSVASGKFVFMGYPWPIDFAIANFSSCYASGTPAGTGAISDGADQIWRWNTEKADWDKYFYRSGRGVTTPGWCKSGETTITEDTVNAGETVFFSRAGNATSAMLSGEVKPFSAALSYSVPKGKFMFMGYPWPVEFAIADFASCYTEGSTPTGTPTIGAGADQIWRWNTASNDWDKYFYRSGRGVTTPGWCKSGETDITTDTIPVGEGFFFSRAGNAATITFTIK